MKPLHLNLASRPYRDYRPVYAAVVVMSLLTAFLMLNNIETFYRYTHETRNTRAKIERLDALAQQEKQREEMVQHRLRNLDLERLEMQTKFVNAKLGERAFSWSTLLDELESVLADDVRLIAISPSFEDQGHVGLTLQFESKSANGMITTMNRMNADPQFRVPFPRNESQLEGGGYSFDLTVEYLPPAPRIASASLATQKVRR